MDNFTVKNLIEYLQTLDPNMPICITEQHGSCPDWDGVRLATLDDFRVSESNTYERVVRGRGLQEPPFSVDKHLFVGQ